LRATLAPAVALFLCVGCGAGNLESRIVSPELELELTEDNTAIVEVMETYAKSIESRDFNSVAALLSKDYYENAGTTDRTEDDYGLAGIKHLFATLGDHVKEVRVEVTIRDLSVEGDRGRVVFDYAFTMLYDVGGEDRWQTARDVNQVELRREDGNWLILSGI
jgi:ketosteroid isomerase-like protein